jgi:hypothetical protein
MMASTTGRINSYLSRPEVIGIRNDRLGFQKLPLSRSSFEHARCRTFEVDPLEVWVLIQAKKKSKREYRICVIRDFRSGDKSCRSVTLAQPHIPKRGTADAQDRPRRLRITTPCRNRTERHRLTQASSEVLCITGIVSSTWISSKRPTLGLPNVFLLEFTGSFRQHSPARSRTSGSTEQLAQKSSWPASCCP